MRRIKALLAGLAAFLAALLWAAIMLLRNYKKQVQIDTLEGEVEAHERINQADTGVGATDAERVKRLQRMADKWGG